ncbi:bacterio-opsin activator domain-containing protein [Natronobacterium gregoryi]|uniref:DNA binding protein n=2 Tax=Natronobacterium gregoryi TaxID=44930 RepID=L0AGR8_NATGS|nr:bacterio-opsin activator domain-containing protein [Natronobacterium gregoryi]AFZ72280.1 putative DNA binding protein [Natronobacterium gregoryi SP2]ELY62319.1 response regulator receiver modulated GAF sensor protein [Natronobacterium gregoryi SP2]PLK18665.1 diguanylate cyclase [Natronobacterium gregoryi SP2]SFJ67626.1 Predicted DNA binding protein, contains HTH domain [Natronobacterium gregoryi]
MSDQNVPHGTNEEPETDGHADVDAETLEILLIEDNPGDARLIEEMLEGTEELAQRIDPTEETKRTPEITHETRLEDSLETVESTPVDVVLLDLNLPDSTGIETLEATGEAIDEATDATPIVVLTGVREQEVGVKALQQGAQDFLVKDEVTSELLVRTIYHAIERARQDRKRRRQRAQLESINWLNRIVHDITHAVITTETRAELEQRVCDRLVEPDAYRFAWIGGISPGSHTVVPKAAAGIERGYLENVEISMDENESTGHGPGGAAIRTGEVQVTNDIETDARFEPWREEARKRGYRSIAAIPIVHEDLVYGVLGIYASSQGAFSQAETTIFSRIGDVIAHAITAIERRDALVSDAVVELEFRITEMAEKLVELSATESCTIEFEQLVSGDDTLLAYGSAQGVSEETFRKTVEETDGIDAVRFLSVRRNEFEFELVSPVAVSLFETIATHGGRVESATIEDGEFRFVVELPRGRDTRQLIELVQEHRPDATYLAQRTTERSVSDDSSSHSVLEEELTEKQRAALETAYFAGYFDWPRESTGEEIAERLGISPATFNQHLRTAERKFFDSVLGE